MASVQAKVDATRINRTNDDATAAICAIHKWGLSYIDEWADYHIALGFWTICIYDNLDDFELLGKLLAKH